jgi:putative ABC transport system ATP-binding protein
MIRLFNLKYKDIVNINHLAIEENAFVALIGHSGSGKTTLLKMMARLISPDQGYIFYQDKDVLSYPIKTYREQVLYLTQKPYLFQGTVKDNLMMGLKYHHMKYSRRST